MDRFHSIPPRPRAVTPSTKVVKHAGKAPAIHASAFVAPTANVIGQVAIGKGSSVWYGATLRGTFALPVYVWWIRSDGWGPSIPSHLALDKASRYLLTNGIPPSLQPAQAT